MGRLGVARLSAAVMLLYMVGGAQVVTLPASAGPETFEVKMISSGRNRPAVDLRKEQWLPICVGLHERDSPNQIRLRLHLTEAEFQNRINKLETAGLVVVLPDSIADHYVNEN